MPSSSLLSDDPSVLLTTAGVQQFKPYYTGQFDSQKDFNSKRIVSIQKCFRTSDIDEVGDGSHLTFFEMLGNFSFGDYGKQEAIKWSYEFITKELGILPDRISVSVFTGDKKTPEDKESYNIWLNNIGINKKKIKKGGAEDNFWGPTGSDGPCGPTTEIYIDGIEIWNIVFNEYVCDGSREDLLAGRAKLKKLAIPGVDTGMGLERLTAVLNNTDSVYATDLFKYLVNSLNDASYSERVEKILADHARGVSFLISDGVRPSNKEAGYVLRRLIRRMISLSPVTSFNHLFGLISEFYKNIYKIDAKVILSVVTEEKSKFNKTLGRGFSELDKMDKISAASAFKLYETYGLPFEVIKDVAGKKAAKLSRKDFDREFSKHQEISRAGLEKKFGGHGLMMDTGELKAANKKEAQKVTRLHTATHLLQQALRDVLGDEVRQRGSDITAERTRFDFAFSRRLTDKEIRAVENLVNKKIKEDLPVKFEELTLEEAKKTGALHYFQNKYPARVKVYYVGRSLKSAYSKEFCGGPHVKNTGEIGKFTILKEEGVGAGLRRIRGDVV